MVGAEDYSFLSALLRSKSGLSLGAGKEYLLESRLPPVAQTFGFGTLTDMVAALRARPHQELVKAVCDAMTTGETLFFRDTIPFDVLRTALLPAMAEKCRHAGRPLRIWSAAASTGQEAYSIAMILDEERHRLHGLRVELLASDYSTAALNKARRGLFTQIEIQRGLPEEYLRKYFSADGDRYKISDDVRRRVTFREVNLLESFRSLGQFDIIFCRNVLIYFDSITKKDVLDRLSDSLARDGHLVLGSTESAFGLTERLVRVAEIPTSIHVRREDAGRVVSYAHSFRQHTAPVG